MENVGEIMRKLRAAKNYSQEFVADKAGVDYTTYSRYERGETSPKFETIVAVCDIYKITLDQFRHFDDPDFKIEEVKSVYQKRWNVPVTVGLDGTPDTLQT